MKILGAHNKYKKLDLMNFSEKEIIKKEFKFNLEDNILEKILYRLRFEKMAKFFLILEKY